MSYLRPVPLSQPVPTLTHEPHTDHMCAPWDITDVWVEAGNDEEQTVHAYFDHNNDGCGQYAPSLVGLRVVDGSTTHFYGPEMSAILLGTIEDVWRIEMAYSERLNA